MTKLEMRLLAVEVMQIHGLVVERLGADYLAGRGEWRATRSHTGRAVLMSGELLFALDEATGEPIAARNPEKAEVGYVVHGHIEWGRRPVCQPLCMN